MNRKEEKRINLAIVHAAEEVTGRKITTLERARLRAFFYGAGREVVFGKKDCGERSLAARRRGNILQYRWAISVEAAKNGCHEEGKRWLEAAETKLRQIMADLGRKQLPVELVVVRVGTDKRALGAPEGKISFN